MGALIVKILVVAIALYIISGFFRQKNIKQAKKGGDLDLIKCEKCGAYISELDAVKNGGKTYCSKECAK
ncbi:hypothetical protein FACS189487_02970 [Campylobacterota bacterium]|nr:hypothetical protein FACS189487_02970 [Campylobacterota bacterium]